MSGAPLMRGGMLVVRSQALYKVTVAVVKTSRVLQEKKGRRGRKEVPKDGDKGCVWFL